MTNFKICASLFSTTEHIFQNVYCMYALCNGVFHIFSSFRYWGETFVGISFPWALTNRNRQVWEFYWMHNNLLTIATKLHIRSGRRMRFVSKTWKLQLDTAIYEYGIYYVYVSTYLDDSLKDLCKRSTIPTGKDHPVWLWEAHWRERNEWKYWASKSFVGSDWFSPLRRVTEVGQSSRLTR